MITNPSSSNAMTSITITKPDDWHVHLRDGAIMASILQHTAKQFARAIVMPNLKPPITTTTEAMAYRNRIIAALPAGAQFEPLMTLYLTNNTPPDEIIRAKDSGIVHAVKMYPAGATTNSDAGVTDLRSCYPTLEAMQKCGLPLSIHGEVTDVTVDVFDREEVFIERILQPLGSDFPELKMVFEHITTRQATDYVRTASGTIAATITPQHLLFNRNEIFKGGIRPHYYCLPILKRETHRQALVGAAISGNPRFFLGTDSAPHAKGAKESSCGCAGCFSALHAMELYTQVFDQVGALDKLENFASHFGPLFYQLPINTNKLTLQRSSWEVPEELPLADTTIVPLHAGETLHWKVV